MTSVHLVRHGQSTWNAERRLQGQTAHPPLTDRGRAEAARAAETIATLVDGQPCAIHSSDLVRARQTADVIAERLQLRVTETAALREQHLGDMQGRLSADLVAQPAPEGEHIAEIRWGGGESVADVHARLREFLDDTLPQGPEHLVLVTHGDTLRIALAVLAGRSHRDVEWEAVPNGDVRTVRVSRWRT